MLFRDEIWFATKTLSIEIDRSDSINFEITTETHCYIAMSET